MNIDYIAGIPLSTNDPSADQPKMLINTTAVNSWVNVDHIGFNNNLGGYHNNIRQPQAPLNVTRSGVGAVFANLPTTIANVNQFFTGNYTPDSTITSTDTELFAISGQGFVSQLTGNINKSDGWQWVGGILIQWGSVTFSAGSDHLTNTVTFKDRVNQAIPFPNNCYSVVATLSNNNSSDTTASNTLAIRQITPLIFRWVYNSSASSGSSVYDGFWWIAIGN